MRELWIHSAVEQLQHLIVRRTINNGVSHQEILRRWSDIQKDMNCAIHQMEKEYKQSVDAFLLEKKAGNKPLVADHKLR